jgi:predicted ATPase
MNAVTNKSPVPFLKRALIRNFRVLHNVEFKSLSPITVLIGENGSGKTTVLEALSFLFDCFTIGLRKTWDGYGGAKGIRTLGEEGPITIEIEYKMPDYDLITYHLSVDEENKRPIVIEEWMESRSESEGIPFRFLEHSAGKVKVIRYVEGDDTSNCTELQLRGRDLIAASVLGQFEAYPQVAALRDFIMGWKIMSSVRKLQNSNKISTSIQSPLLNSFTSLDLNPLNFGNLTHNDVLSSLICIEESAISVYPTLLPKMVEEFRNTTPHTQFIITTQSPLFLNALRPEEVWVLYRNRNGYTQVRRVDDIPHVTNFIKSGGLIGDLWLEGYVDCSTFYG